MWAWRNRLRAEPRLLPLRRNSRCRLDPARLNARLRSVKRIESCDGFFVIDKRASAGRLLDAQMKQNFVQRTRQMSKVLLRVGIVLLFVFALTCYVPAQTALIGFDFTGRVFSTFDVPNAGTSVSGYIIFDPSARLTATCGPHCARYSQFPPATFGSFFAPRVIAEQQQQSIHSEYQYPNDASKLFGVPVPFRIFLRLH